jgi:hypothetical protein
MLQIFINMNIPIKYFKIQINLTRGADGRPGPKPAGNRWTASSVGGRCTWVLRLVSVFAGLLVHGHVHADWSLDPAQNNPVISAAGHQQYHQAVSDGDGGAFVVWQDNRNSATSGTDIYIQHIGRNGIRSFADGGLVLCAESGNQSFPFLVSDGAGGAIVFWVDYRTGDADIYAQRLSSDGTLLWNHNGKPIASGTGDQTYLYSYYKLEGFVADAPSQGAYLAYSNNADGDRDVYVQKIDGNGLKLWGPEGVKVTNLANDDQAQRIMSDGSGGLLVVWENFNSGNGESRIYAQRLNASGAKLWSPADGVLAVPDPYRHNSTVPSRTGDPEIAADGSGGVIIVFNTYPGLSVGELYMQRIDANGNPLWGDSGLALSNESQTEMGYIIVSDGQGKYYIVWADQRAMWWETPGPVIHYESNYDIYAQKIDLNGNKLWNATGLLVNNQDSVQYVPDALLDPSGNLVIAWRDDRVADTGQGSDIHIQKLDPDGNLLWPSAGMPVSTAAANQTEPQLLLSSPEAAIAVWSDYRNGNWDVYASYFSLADGSLADPAPFAWHNYFFNASVSSANNNCTGLPEHDNGSAMGSVHEGLNHWIETFDDLPVGSTGDPGTTPWSREGTPLGHAEVRAAGTGRHFEVNNAGSEMAWISGPIDISATGTVRVLVEVSSQSSAGEYFESDDYLRVFYRIDGGVEQAVAQGSFTGAVDNTADSPGHGADRNLVVIDGLQGSSLQIIVRMRNDHAAETYAIDDVTVLTAGAETAGFTLQWFYESVAGAPVFTGSSQASLKEGDWYVRALHDATGETSMPVLLVVERLQENPVLTVELMSGFTNCAAPDGHLRAQAVVSGQEPAVVAAYTWYRGSAALDENKLAAAAEISGLDAGTYTVLVASPASGCTALATVEVPDQTSTPVAVIHVDRPLNTCNTEEPGAQLSASVAETTEGYSFYWFHGAPADTATADFRGDVYGNLEAGSYSVVAVDRISRCASLPQSTTVEDIRDVPVVTVGVISHQTGCDPQHPLGALQADANGQTAGYLFYWFAGESADPGLREPDYQGALIENLPAGDYTVVAVSELSGCASAPVTKTLQENPQVPVITLVRPEEVPGTPEGQFSAHVDGRTEPDFKFEWYKSSSTGPNNLLGSSSTISGLDRGIYTLRVTDLDGGCADEIDFISTLEPPLPPLVISGKALSPWSIELIWQIASNDTEGFLIERRSDADADLATIADLGAGIREYVDSGLEPDTWYSYRLSAYNRNGVTRNSESIRIKTLKLAPSGQPLNLVGEIAPPEGIALDWVYPESDEEGFIVERLDQNGSAFMEIGRTEDLSYVDTGVNGGQEYTYRITAYNDGGVSAYSQPVTVVTDLDISGMEIYPNPTSDFLFIRNRSLFPFDVKLYSSDGKLILVSEQNRGDLQLDLRTLSKQTIVVHIAVENKVLNTKVVKQ